MNLLYKNMSLKLIEKEARLRTRKKNLNKKRSQDIKNSKKITNYYYITLF